MNINTKVLSWVIKQKKINISERSFLSTWLKSGEVPSLDTLQAFAMSIDVPWGIFLLSSPPTADKPVFLLQDEKDKAFSSLVGWFDKRHEWLRSRCIESICVEENTTPEQVAQSIRDYFHLPQEPFDIQLLLSCLSSKGVFLATGVNNGKRLQGIVFNNPPLLLYDGKMHSLLFALAHLWLKIDVGFSLSEFPEDSFCGRVVLELSPEDKSLPYGGDRLTFDAAFFRILKWALSSNQLSKEEAYDIAGIREEEINIFKL